MLLQLTDTLSKSLVLLHDLPLSHEETVMREDRLLKVLTENG
jgi:hypothetical protein